MNSTPIAQSINMSIEPFDSFTTEQKKQIWAYYESIKIKTIENELLTFIADFVRTHEIDELRNHCLDNMVSSKHKSERSMFKDLFVITDYFINSDFKKTANLRALTDQGHTDTADALNKYLIM